MVNFIFVLLEIMVWYFWFVWDLVGLELGVEDFDVVKWWLILKVMWLEFLSEVWIE